MTISKILKKKKRGGGSGGKDETEEVSDIEVPEVQESVEKVKRALDDAKEMISDLTPRRRGGRGFCGCGG